MSTYYRVLPIIGISLQDYVIEIYIPGEKHVFKFDGVEYPVLGCEYCNNAEGAESYTKGPLELALEKAFPGLSVFYPPRNPAMGYIGLTVGETEDQGQVVVNARGSRSEVHNKFHKVQEVLGYWPELHLMWYTF